MKIMYFAWMREHIGASLEQLDLPTGITNIRELVEYLRSLSDGHARALSDMDVVRVAVNQTYTDLDKTIAADDEVAFFPPVTGG
ncbi:MAG: molybdopterin converting factor subunit 1 [Candidatus Puniceispirillales bacterium WSBS_2018_MAG_OTU23]